MDTPPSTAVLDLVNPNLNITLLLHTNTKEDEIAYNQYAWVCSKCSVEKSSSVLNSTGALVWWHGDNCYYHCQLSHYDSSSGRYLASYDDGSNDWEWVHVGFQSVLVHWQKDM